MKKQEIIDKHWLDFLKWGKHHTIEFQGKDISFNNWTEEAFWRWYVEEIL